MNELEWKQCKDGLNKDFSKVFRDIPNFPLSDCIYIFVLLIEGKNQFVFLEEALYSFYITEKRSELDSVRRKITFSIETFLKTIFSTLEKNISGTLFPCLRVFFHDIGLGLSEEELKKIGTRSNNPNPREDLEYFNNWIPNIGKNFKRIYDFRNSLVHEEGQEQFRDGWRIKEIRYPSYSVDLLDEDLFQSHVKECLSVYLFIIYKYLPLLKEKLIPQESEYNFSNYIENELKNFHKKRTIDFISLNVKETEVIDYSDEIVLMAKEYYEEESSYQDTDEDVEEDESDLEEESISEIDPIERFKTPTRLADIISQIPKMIVRGEAGMGKSTTLLHLFLDKLNQVKLSATEMVPFFFELKDYNGKDLIEQISKVKTIPMDTIKQLVQEGRAFLFLDGMDEVINQEKRRNLEIDIKENILPANSSIIISSRIREYSTDIFSIRIFDLQPLKDEQIKEYASKNLEEAKKELFLKVLFDQENKRLLSVCRNIFILKIYKKEISEKGEIVSKNIGRLLQNLIKETIHRELNKPNGLELRNKIGTYSMMIQYLAFMLLDQECDFEYNYSIVLLRKEYGTLDNPNDCLNFYKRLGMILGEYDTLKFVHKLYLEYFAAEYILLKVKLDGIQALDNFLENEKWEKVLVLLSGLAENFKKVIEKIAPKKVLTAAQSLTSSIEEHPEETKLTIEQAIIDAKNFQDIAVSSNGFLALIELEEFEKISKILENIKPKPIHRNVIKSIVEKEAVKSLSLLDVFANLSNKQFLLWIIELIPWDDVRNYITYETISRVIQVLENKEYFHHLSILINSLPFYKDDILDSLRFYNINSIRSVNKVIQLIQKNNLKKLLPLVIRKIISIGSINSISKAILLIKENQLEEQFFVSLLIQKLIDIGSINSINKAIQLIKENHLEDRLPVSLLIQKLICAGSIDSIDKAIQLIKENYLEDKFSVSLLIQKLIDKDSVISISYAIELIKKYQLESEFPISLIIQKLVNHDSVISINYAIELVKKYQLEKQFPINSLVKKSIRIRKADQPTKEVQLESKSFNKPTLQQGITKEFIIQLANKYKNSHQVISYIVNLNNKNYPTDGIIQYIQEELINKGKYFIASFWIKSFRLQEQFPPKKYIDQFLSEGKTEQARFWITKFKLEEEYKDKL